MKLSKWLLILLVLCSAVVRAAESSDGELSGRFAINADGDLVCFSKGNLTYTQSTQTWAFAEHQYDVIGQDNLVGDELADKIDLFGWSGDHESAIPYGVYNSSSTLSSKGNFKDWGKNTISNGGKGWRTLTKEEWTYLLANHNQFPTKINGVQGIAIMPQGVKLDVKPSVYTLEQWAADEAKGVIFLPFTGYREGKATTVSNLTAYGFYWTATAAENDPTQESAYTVRCREENAAVLSSARARSRGQAVRLVKSKSACTVTISVKTVPNAGGTITIETVDDNE